MKTVEKILLACVSTLLVALLAFLVFMIYSVSTTTCLERGTIKRIVSVDGAANRAVVELTDGGTTTIVIGQITEGKTVCKTYGEKK